MILNLLIEGSNLPSLILLIFKDKHCWQYSLISSPSGYGKSRLLKRLIKQIENDPEKMLIGVVVTWIWVAVITRII